MIVNAEICWKIQLLFTSKKYLDKVVEMLVMAQNYVRVPAMDARPVNVVSQTYYI